ncbi:hypothetical protein HYU17_01665 [Candidatus Woesearchaeota archaeon]|nr:hypothetical protein [Candidatus Woesearchaeota archaeon]
MNLYIKKDGVLKRATVPVFAVKDLLFKGLKEEELQTIFGRAVEEENVVPYDLGVFFIDSDKKAIVSAQMAFSLDDLSGASQKISGWKYVELEAEAAPELILTSLQ